MMIWFGGLMNQSLHRCFHTSNGTEETFSIRGEKYSPFSSFLLLSGIVGQGGCDKCGAFITSFAGFKS